MSKQAFGLGLAKASAAIAKALGGTATIIFGGDDAELVLDSTSGKYVAPNGSTSLEVPFSPSTSRKNLSASTSRKNLFVSTVDGYGTQSATNIIACDLNGRVPGSAFPNAVLPTPEKDSFVFNGETYRIVSVETNYVQNVLVEAILYGAKK